MYESTNKKAVFLNLHRYTAVDRGALSDVLLQVVVTAYDPIYDADVCAMKVYDPAHFAFNSFFAGVMSSNAEGESVIEFDRIHDVVPQPRKVFKALAMNSPSPRIDRPAVGLYTLNPVVTHSFKPPTKFQLLKLQSVFCRISLVSQNMLLSQIQRVPLRRG